MKKCLWLKKIKTLCRGHMSFSDLKGKEIVGMFHEKELQKKKKELRIEKVINRKNNK